MMIAEQVRQSYGRTQFVYNTTQGSVLVVLTLDKGTEAEQVQMCRPTEALHGLLEMTEPLILSGRFTRLAQLSSVYWQARHMAAYSDRTQKVCYLSGESLVRCLLYTSFLALLRCFSSGSSLHTPMNSVYVTRT